MMWQKTLEDLLARAIGLDPASLGPTLLLRAVHRRMKALDVSRESEYVQRNLPAHGELQELIEELVVSESWFFRDSQPFHLLRKHATDWLAAPTGGVYRTLSLACATGDEPYSIAITLLDLGFTRDRYEIDAIDISFRALEKARRAVYNARALRVVEAPLKAKYFRPHPDGLEVAPEVRASVRFSRGNLVEPDSLVVRPPYQAIFCRNLLIYLTDAARERAVGTLDRLLGPTGLLFVGHAERLPLLESRFSPVKFRGSFAYQRRGAAEATNSFGSTLSGATAYESSRPSTPAGGTRSPFAASGPSNSASSSSSSSPFPAAVEPRPSFLDRGATSSVPEPTRSPPSPPVSSARDNGSRPSSPFPAIPAVPSPAPAPSSAPIASIPSGELLERASDLANRHEYEQASQLCDQSIRLKGPSAAAFYLLGMIRHALGDHVHAEQYLSRAVYLDGQHEEALLALSLIARRRGDHSAATNYQRRAERARQRKTS
jgi:chemotaxis protein methyltransferase WspC